MPRDYIKASGCVTVAELRDVLACADSDAPVHLADVRDGTTTPIKVAMFDAESDDNGVLIYTDND